MTVTNVTVLGAGQMGAGIAQRAALAGYDTVIHDLAEGAGERAIETVRSGQFGLEAAVKRELVTQDEADAALARLRSEPDLEAALAEADVVIEAIFEDLAVKIRQFRALDRLCPPGAILASNTSGFPIEALAAATDRPGLVFGWHFASPVPVMKLSEIVVHPESDPAARDTLVEVAQRMGVNPEVINDDPFHYGFVANRVLFAAIREAQQIVADGIATPAQVDRLVKDCFRWPIGPLEMSGGIEKHHYYAGSDPNNPPPSMSAAYPTAARTRRGLAPS